MERGRAGGGVEEGGFSSALVLLLGLQVSLSGRDEGENRFPLLCFRRPTTSAYNAPGGARQLDRALQPLTAAP